MNNSSNTCKFVGVSILGGLAAVLVYFVLFSIVIPSEWPRYENNMQTATIFSCLAGALVCSMPTWLNQHLSKQVLISISLTPLLFLIFSGEFSVRMTKALLAPSLLTAVLVGFWFMPSKASASRNT